MPRTRMRHTIINTRNTWLHGDPRGFRDRGHRIHSSGDYHNPPPPTENYGLHDYMQSRAGDEVHIAQALRPVIGRAILQWCRENDTPIDTLSVGKVHTHFLITLPEPITDVRRIVGEIKRFCSRAVKKEMPGSIWAAGGTYKPISDDHHEQSTDEYVLYNQGPEAWSWSVRDGLDEGVFARVKPDI